MGSKNSKKSDGFTVEYSFKSVMDKLSDQDDTLTKIHKQVKATNGRVTTLEKVGIGIWIRNNPFKFTLGALTLFSIVISDIRHPILAFIQSLI